MAKVRVVPSGQVVGILDLQYLNSSGVWTVYNNIALLASVGGVFDSAELNGGTITAIGAGVYEYAALDNGAAIRVTVTPEDDGVSVLAEALPGSATMDKVALACDFGLCDIVRFATSTPVTYDALTYPEPADGAGIVGDFYAIPFPVPGTDTYHLIGQTIIQTYRTFTPPGGSDQLIFEVRRHPWIATQPNPGHNWIERFHHTKVGTFAEGDTIGTWHYAMALSAITTEDRRAAAVGMGLIAGRPMPVPDGAIGAGDRYELAGSYRMLNESSSSGSSDMTTLKAIAREMITRNPTAIGRLLTINSLTTTTAVCNALATGGLTSNAFATDYMVRRDASAASAADRIRYAPSLTTSSGTLTHTGTNYADTTATSETLELVHFHPDLIDQAIQVTLGRLRRLDRYIIPARTGVFRYQLEDLSWVHQPADVIDVRLHTYPVLSNNMEMERWGDVDANTGNVQPDAWTSTLTMARSTTHARPGDGYLVQLTRGGADANFYQSIGLLDSDVSADTLRGDTVTAWFIVWSSVASQVRAYVDDNGTPQYGSYHTGGSGWEEITKSVTVSSSATKLDFGLRVETDNTACYVARGGLVYGSITDNVRRGRPPGTLLNRDEYDFDQTAQTIRFRTPRSKGMTFEIITARPYPLFDDTRLTAGTADADTTDAPLEVVATGAIGRMFEGLAEDESNKEKRARYAQIAAVWNKRFEELALSHLGIKPKNGFGVDIPFPRTPTRVGRI